MAIYSLQVEKHTISGIIKYPDIFSDIAPYVTEKDFFDDIHSTIFLVIKSLFEKGEKWDKVLLAEKIKNLGVSFKDDINIYDYIDNLSYIPITKPATVDAAKELVKIRIRRDLDATGDEIKTFVKTNGNLSVDEIIGAIDAIYGKKASIYTPEDQPVNLYLGLEEMVEERGNKPVEETGLKSPYSEFNRLYGGFKTKQIYAFASRPGQGKALWEETLIPTPSGWSKIKDLKVNDKVFAVDGSITKVVATQKWNNRKMFQVKTDDGHFVIADAKHEWVVQKRSDYKWGCYETEELYNKPLDKRPKLPLVGALNLPYASLDIPPYILGLWLGDGNSNSLALTSKDCFILEKWIDFGKSNTIKIYPSNPLTIHLRSLKHRYKNLTFEPFHKLGLVYNKHIPVCYLRASIEQRIELLQGLIDSDGYVAPDGQVEFCNTNKKLAEDFLELIHSLGIKASFIEEDAKLYGRIISKKYRIRFYYEKAAKLPRKANLCRNSKRTPYRYIDILPYGVGNTVCIEIEHKSHLFLCGKAMIPTHNSTLINDVCVKTAQLNNIKAFICDTEMSTEDTQWRAIAARSGVPQWFLETGNWRKNAEMVRKVRAAFEEVRRLRDGNYVTHFHVGNKNLDQLISIIRRWHAKNVKKGEKCIIAYDYLKLTMGEKVDKNWAEYQVLGEKIDRLKRLAEELDAVIITAIQLNRSGENFNRNASDVTDDAAAIAVSDRLQWFAAFVAIFRRKTIDEINRDGQQFGTHKCIPLKTRFQGRDAAGHHDLVRRVDENGDPKWVNNYLNFAVNNFDVTELGSLRDIVSAESDREAPEDRNPNDGGTL